MVLGVDIRDSVTVTAFSLLLVLPLLLLLLGTMLKERAQVRERPLQARGISRIAIMSRSADRNTASTTMIAATLLLLYCYFTTTLLLLDCYFTSATSILSYVASRVLSCQAPPTEIMPPYTADSSCLPAHAPPARCAAWLRCASETSQ